MNLSEWIQNQIHKSSTTSKLSIRYGEYYTNIFLNDSSNFNNFKQYFDTTLKNKLVKCKIYKQPRFDVPLDSAFRVHVPALRFGGLKLINNKVQLTLWLPGLAAKVSTQQLKRNN